MKFENLGQKSIKPGDHLALIDYTDAAREYSGNQLEALVQRYVSTLGDKVARGDRIGLLAQNSADMLASLMAIMRIGAVAVPMNTKFPTETLDHICTDASLKFVLTSGAPRGLVCDEVQMNSGKLAVADVQEPSEKQAALVLYTSGSTGTPKGVELSHHSQLSMLDKMSPRMKGQTGIVAAPLYHMNGLLFLLSLVAGGGTAILMSRFQAQEYLSAIDRYKVTLLTGVPTMLALCLKEQEMVSALDLTSVRSIQIGSAPLSEALLGPVEQMFPNASIFNAYGTTEVGAGIFGPHPDKIPIPKVALGYPRPHVKVRLVGGATPSEGVLEVKTEAAMSGYLNLPDKTAEKISDGWINTGDVMRIDENGFYFFVGRNDDMFVCGGENVYPGQVERILEKDERIHEVCVVARPDEVKGQLPIAFIVKAPQVTISEDDVKQLALEKAPAYMHPREVVFIESMPLAGTNKIDRKVLELRATDRKYKGDIQCVAAILGQQQSVYVIGCES